MWCSAGLWEGQCGQCIATPLTILMQYVSVMHGHTLVLVLCSRILSVESDEMFCIYLLGIISTKGKGHYSPCLISGTLPSCEDKNGERSVVAVSGLERHSLHSTGR